MNFTREKKSSHLCYLSDANFFIIDDGRPCPLAYATDHRRVSPGSKHLRLHKAIFEDRSKGLNHGYNGSSSC